MEKPLEVFIAILIPFRNRKVILGLQQILHGLNDSFVILATPSLIAGYRFKLTTQCLKVALINWGNFKNVEEY